MLMVARLHFAWLMGLTSVEPLLVLPLEGGTRPAARSSQPLLRSSGTSAARRWRTGRDLGQPCIGDVLLAIANRRRDGSLFPTPSDNFKPDNSSLDRANRRRDQEYSIGKVGMVTMAARIDSGIRPKLKTARPKSGRRP